jgi:hypothetical protein
LVMLLEVKWRLWGRAVKEVWFIMMENIVM